MACRWLLPLVTTCFVGIISLGCGGSKGAGISLDGGELDGAKKDGGTKKDGGGLGGGDSGTKKDGASLKDGSHAADGHAGDGAAPTCTQLGTSCTKPADCCSNVCVGDVCVSSSATCNGSGGGCTVGTDCCTGACVAGVCSAEQCVSLGEACPPSGNACCTDTCVGGKCATIGGGVADGSSGGLCTTAGNTCSSSAQCCSGLCANGTCDPGSSYCSQVGDICFSAATCCGGVCNSPNASPVSGTNPGTCAVPPGVGGTNCTGLDGTLCNPAEIGCASGCCSHLCAPYGLFGIAICQQAQGCHVEGDLCRQDGDCCGGEATDSGILGAGAVTCSIATGATIGFCSTPGPNGGGGTCVPEGDVCHYTSGTGDAGYPCSSSAARSDCCGPQNPKFLACKLDHLGVPRCLAYGLSDAGVEECRQAGDTCAAAADCCNGQPCVPNGNGQLTCASTACIPTTGICTSTADCCAGILCIVPPGAIGGTCTPPPPPPPPPDAGTGGHGDGGTHSGDAGHPRDAGGHDAGGGGGTCAEIGQSCVSLGCCAGLSCIGGSCIINIH